LNPETENLISRYLLGELPDAECEAFEVRYFAESGLFDEITAVEAHLVDDYARGRLEPPVRKRFEQHYLNHPRRRERAAFAEALTATIDSLDSRAEKKASLWEALSKAIWARPAWRLSTALAGFLLVIGGTWFLFTARDNTGSEVAQAPLPISTATQPNEEAISPAPAASVLPTLEPAPQQSVNSNAPLRPTPAKSIEPQPAPRTVSLALQIGAVRGSNSGSTPVMVIRGGTAAARLSIDVDNTAYPSYRLILTTFSGTPVTSRTIKIKSPASRPDLSVNVKASTLRETDYILTVVGVSEDGTTDTIGKSLFRVKRAD
jgi:hypothetical protein